MVGIFPLPTRRELQPPLVVTAVDSPYTVYLLYIPTSAAPTPITYSLLTTNCAI